MSDEVLGYVWEEPADSPHVLIRHSGGWPHVEAGNLRARFHPAELAGIPFRDTQQAHWYIADCPQPPEVERVYPAHDKTVGWKLKEGVSIPGYPNEIAAGAVDREDDLDLRLYDQLTEPVPERRETLTVRWLDTAPPPFDGLTWYASLPHYVTAIPGMHHNFPGELRGFRVALASALREMYGLPDDADSIIRPRSGGYIQLVNNELHISLAVPFVPPLSRQPLNPRTLKPKRGAAPVDRWLTRTKTLVVPDTVAGNTRAQAVTEWNRRIAAYCDQLRDLGYTACGHCEGRGYVET